MKKKKIAVIGGGAAGMFAAVHAAANGCEVHLFEKNEKLGKKVYITGKGRCNLTNACETEELFDAVVTNPKFLYSAFYGYTNQDVIAFFEKAGMKTKTERGERVFPVSDHSTDVIDALRRKLREYKVQVHLNTEVSKVEAKDAKVTGVWLAGEKKLFPADAVLVATGGISYKTTGSTGDGYRFAEELGHKVTDLYPSLVPFNTREAWAKELQGLSLKNVDVRVMDGKKKLYDGFGEMMFTHFGVTGPLILSASSYTAKTVRNHRILRDFEESRNKQFKNALGGLFPAKLTPVMIRLSGISPEKKVNEIAREERMAFVDLIKNLPLTITGLRDYNEAIITKGGVTVREVNPSTMESKLVKGLYFAGEVLDLDAVTGGFNLQIAWSTAYAAGNAV